VEDEEDEQPPTNPFATTETTEAYLADILETYKSNLSGNTVASPAVSLVSTLDTRSNNTRLE
jgi:hypothetical protein